MNEENRGKKRLNASRKLIELSTDCLQTMTSDDLRFSLKKQKLVHPGQLQTPSKHWDNIFLRESPQSIQLPVRKRDGRRLFRLGTDRALEEVTRTLEQVVPLRKLLANIQKKVRILSTQVKDKSREPEEPKKVMSLPGLGIYIVPKPPTSMQAEQLGETHKRTASYSTYCPIVVHTRPSATNQKEFSESIRKSPSVCVVDRGTQLSPKNESENGAQHGDTANDNFIHVEERKLTSPTEESNNFLEKPAVATQTMPPTHDSTLDSETPARQRQILNGGANNCCEMPAVATQTISKPTIVDTSHRLQPQESKLTKKDMDSLQISEFPNPYLPSYLPYSQQVTTNKYPQSGHAVNTDLFQKQVQTVSPVNWNPPSVNISCESSPAVQLPQDWSVVNNLVDTSHRLQPQESKLTKKDMDALQISEFPNPYLPPYLPYSQQVTTNKYPQSGHAVNTDLFQKQVQTVSPVNWNPPSVNISCESSPAVQLPQDWSVVNNLGFTLNNKLPQTQEIYPNPNSYFPMGYLPSNDDRPNICLEHNVYPYPEQRFPSFMERERPVNIVQPQNRYNVNANRGFPQTNHVGPLTQTRELLTNCLPQVNGIVYPPYSGNDIGNYLPLRQAANVFPEQSLVPNHFPPPNSFPTVQQPQDWYNPNQSINFNPNHIQNARPQPRNFSLEPEGDVSVCKSRNDIEVDSQQNQIVSSPNNPTGDSSTNTHVSRGGIVSQINHMKLGSQESDVNSPRVGGLVCAPRFGDSLETDPFQLEVMPGVQVTACPRTPDKQPSKEEVSHMSQMYLKLAEPWSRQRHMKQKDDQAIGELQSLLSDPADTI